MWWPWACVEWYLSSQFLAFGTWGCITGKLGGMQSDISCSLPCFTPVHCGGTPIGRPRHKAIGISWQHGFFPLPLSCCPEVSSLISTGTSLLSLSSASNIIASNQRDTGYPLWGGVLPKGLASMSFMQCPCLDPHVVIFARHPS